MGDVLPQLVLVVVLVIVNAAFSGTELALVSLREAQLQRLEAESARGATLARLARNPNQFLATIQIGITLAGFLASAAAAVTLAEPLEGPLGFLGGAAEPVSVVVVTILLAYLTLVFGELAPKRIALQRAEPWAMAMARPLSWLTTATRPVVWLLSKTSDGVVRLVGADPSRQREEISSEELREMVAGHAAISADQQLIIDGAFEVADRSLDKILVPRSSVFVLDADDSCAEARRALADSGHSRAPVAVGANLDETIGVVNLRELLDADADRVAEIASAAPAFPESAHVLPTMRDLQGARVQMAVVVNEHGGAEGIITMEDLIEELVGEIYDETDPDLTPVRRDDLGRMVVPGSHRLHDLRTSGVELPEGNYATVAGLVLDELGRLAEPGDVVTVDGWRIEVTAVARRAITEVTVEAVPPVDGDVSP